ncbi:MAG: Rne/Rng family ribonuclease [Bdellovibrionota bacterium]
MSTELIINASLPETRIALLENGEIQDILVEREKGKGIVGNIYKGRVTRVLPGMQAAFVDIGLEKAAFLYVDDVFVHPEIWEEEEGSASGAEIDVVTAPVEEPLPEEPVSEVPTPGEPTVASHEDGDDDDDDRGPVEMGTDPSEKKPDDVVIISQSQDDSGSVQNESQDGVIAETVQADSGSAPPITATDGIVTSQHDQNGRRRSRRGRRGGRYRRRTGRSDNVVNYTSSNSEQRQSGDRQSFRESRPRGDRRMRPIVSRPVRGQVNIQDLLSEGQEVLVQVAKDPIAAKGARLTCHISLPGRHLVCMPTIDHVGVSRRIERDDERRRLRDFVEHHRPRNLGFIVRTASGKQQSAEKRLKQDIDYLTNLWGDLREKAASVTAPALVYEDLNPVLRAIRDWVTEDIDKIIVDSRYHYGEIQQFVSHFMPALRHKVELYHGDIPIFDAYNISSELSRALEQKVWLKSGGYIVIDQTEALVTIDVNTGRYVGKKNLEDTILKTNLEAVQEISYQLRLRNCGGIIIIDLIDMEKEENRQRVYRALEDALKKDRARPTIMKISDLGLIEMTRKRTRDTIIRTLCESCVSCEGKGFIKNRLTVAYEILRQIEREGIERDITKVLVKANPDVVDILAIDERDTLDQLERKYRKQIFLQAVLDFHQEQFEISGEKQSATDRGKEEVVEQVQSPVLPPASSKVTPNPEDTAARSSDLPSEELSDQKTDKPSDNDVIKPLDVLTHKGEEGSDEEDRLAFLRAQAAQDAALARLRTSSEPIRRPGQVGGSTRPGGGSAGDGGPRAGRNSRRGRYGSGKFRRGGGSRHHPRVRVGPRMEPPAAGESPVKIVVPAPEAAASAVSDESKKNDNSGGTPAGDSTQPPV